MGLLTTSGALTAAGASALSSGVNFVTNIGGSVAGGLFSANQAKKNRAFQERMYKRQVEDTINFWNMQNEYNLPSAVYQRELQGLKDNGLNPLLMYGQGGSMSGNLASQPQLPSAPHGAQGSVGSFNTSMDLANLALVEAQAKNLESQTNLNNQNADLIGSENKGIQFQNELNNLTKKLLVDLRYDQHILFLQHMREIDNNIWNATQLTNQQTLTLMQSRLYQAKEYELNAWSLGEQWKVAWENVASGRIQANAAWKNSCASMLNAVSNWNFNNAQIGYLGTLAALNRQQYGFNEQMNPQLINNAKWLSHKYKWEITNTQQDAVNKFYNNQFQYMQNQLYRQYGVTDAAANNGSWITTRNFSGSKMGFDPLSGFDVSNVFNVPLNPVKKKE